MAEGSPSEPTPPTPEGPGEISEQGLWQQLGEATSAEAFAAAWLALQARGLGGVSGGLAVLERGAQEGTEATAVWPASFQPPPVLSATLRRAVRERRGIVARAEPEAGGSPDGLLIAYPIRVGKRVHGAAAFHITQRPQAQLEAALRQLQWGASWLQNWILRSAGDPRQKPTKRLSTVLELCGLALEEERFRGAATAVVTELASRLRCDRVALGFLSGKQVKVHALSHSAQFGKQMNLIRAIGAAMGESLDQQAVLRWPEDDDSGRQVMHAHTALARHHGDAAVLTVPFVTQSGRAYGALTFERTGDEPFDEGTVELLDGLGALLGPVLDEKRKNDRLLITKAGESLWTQVKRLLGPEHAGRKLAALAVLALALFFAFAEGDYRVTAPANLEGEVQRAITAPFRGFVYEAEARAGDIVEQGQVLCSLDVRDLSLEYSRWSTEREQHMLEHRRAQAEGDRAAMAVLAKRMGQAEAQLALLDEQLARARITAPFDGLVVSGDLSQSLGAPVDTGEVLFQVAPLDSYRVVLQVDEKDIGAISVGQTGRLILTSMPDEELSFRVTKITPVSYSEEGRNYFEVETRLDQTSARLRPGMEGFGKVAVDRRKLAWIWTHDLVDWVRLKAWRWLP